MERSTVIPSQLVSLMTQPHITDICLNGASEVFVDSGQGMQKRESIFDTEKKFNQWILSVLGALGKSWDARDPFVDGQLKDELFDHRVHVVFPPASPEKTLVSIRRNSGPQLQQMTWNEPVFSQLICCIENSDSVLICGGTGSGKTTLLSQLLSHIPSSQRIIALEDTPELRPHHPHFLSLQSRPPNADGFGEITLRRLLQQALRMRPDRIVLGECRGAEVLDLLLSLNTGHRGMAATLHANSCRDAIARIQLLAMIAAPQLHPKLCQKLIAGGFQWVAHLQQRCQSRQIVDLQRIEGIEGDTVLMRPMLKGKDESASFSTRN